MMKLPKTMNNAPKRARTPKMMRTAILAALAVAATACSNDLPDASGNTPDTPNRKTTIHVSAGQKAGTRVAYEDAAAGKAGKLTWQTGDRLTVVRMNGKTVTGKENDYLYQGIDGATSGDFEGTEIVAEGNSWTVYYPHTVTVNNSDGSATLPMTGQTQTANENTEHLKNYMLLACTGIEDINSSFTLAMKSSIMKFDLKGVPAGVGKLKTLTWMVETAAATRILTLNFAPDAVDFGSNGGTLTAFLSFMPQDMVVKTGGKFTVVLTGDKTYQASATISNGKTYEAGKRYTATFDDWEEKAMMALTVKVRENEAFQIPFGTYRTSPAALTIDWGDGTEPTTVVEKGASFDANTFKHTYAKAGTYTITITSAQTDATEQQIPEFNFESGVDPSTAMQNAAKLISIDTPLLNMKTLALSACFKNCFNLTSIPPGLFDNNTMATRFSYCFQGCSNLTSIPQGLFDKHTEATNFSSCFYGCVQLALNEKIFSTGSDVERFADKTMNFTACFQNVGTELGANMGGDAPNLWGYNKGNANWTTKDCFKGAVNLTNWTSIPEAWGGPSATRTLPLVPSRGSAL